MAIILRLQGLPWSATASDIRQYFVGLSIPDGGVHIVGGDEGDVFIAFTNDEDARQAMRRQKEPLMGVRVMILLSSKSEMQEVIAKSRQAQGRDPFDDSQSAPNEPPAPMDVASSALKFDHSGEQSFDRRDVSVASPMSPDPSQGGRPMAGDNFQDRRMAEQQDARNRRFDAPYNEPYNRTQRAAAPENGSFGHPENNRQRDFQDHDRRTPQQTWQRDTYPDGRNDAGPTCFSDPHQPFYSDPPRGEGGLLGDIPGHRVASQPSRGPQSDQNRPKGGDIRNRDLFGPDHGRENQQAREDSMNLSQRFGRPHPQDPFEGAGRDDVRGEYAQEPGRDGRTLRDRNFGPPKEGPLASEDPSLPHDIAYKHEIEESLCVYLKGLPFTTKEHEVVDFFCGLRIARDGIKFVLDPHGRPTGDGFVKFVSKRDTVEALKRHQSYVGNRYVEVIPCTEAEYQSMKQPMSVQSTDGPARGRNMLGRNESHGLPALLEIPTKEPFTPQDRDHRRDMPFSGRDGPDHFPPRNKGPGGPNYHLDNEGGPLREGFPSGNRDDFNPGNRDGFNQGSREDFIPGSREGFNPGNRDRFNPGSRDRFNPSSREGFNAGVREGFPPGSREGGLNLRDRGPSGPLERGAGGSLDRNPGGRGLSGPLDRGPGGPLDRSSMGLFDGGPSGPHDRRPGGHLDRGLGGSLDRSSIGPFDRGSGGSLDRGSGGHLDRGPGGLLDRGPGGRLDRGPGGLFDLSPGGPLDLGPGGSLDRGLGGRLDRGPGGLLDRGPGGLLDLGPGGPLDLGPGGPLDRGPGGRLDRGPGGRLDRYPGGSLDRGPRGRFDRGPGGLLDLGPGGPLDLGPGGPLDRSPGGLLNRGPSGPLNIGSGGPLNRGPGGTNLRFREDDNQLEAGLPSGMHGARGRPAGLHPDDRMEFDEFNNRNPADSHGRPEVPQGRSPAPFERESARPNGPQGRDMRMQENKFERERGKPEMSLEKERGRPPGLFDRERGRPDGSFDRDRPRSEGQSERDYRRPDREGAWPDAPMERERRRPDRPSDRDRGRPDAASEKEKTRSNQKDKIEPTTRSDSRDKPATSDSSRDRRSPAKSKEKDRSTSERGSSREKRGSDRSRSKDRRDKTSSSEEKSKDRGSRDKHVHNGPYSARGDRDSDRDRRKSPSKSSRSHRDRSRSPVRSQCVELKGIPDECQTEDIYQFFKGLQVASSEGVYIPYDSKTGKVIGNCYVKFASDPDSISALKRSGSSIGRNVIEIFSIPKEIMEVRVKDYKKRLMDSTTLSSPKVKPVVSSPEQKKPVEVVVKPELNNIVKMENVPYLCNLDEIYKFFPDCQISRRGVRFIRHVDGLKAGKSSGVVFVEFVNEADATRAKAKRDQQIRGRIIRINIVSRDVFDEAMASQSGIPDRRQMNRDSDDRMNTSGQHVVVPGGPVPLLPRYGSGPLLRPGMPPSGLSRPGPFGKPRLGLLQSGPRQLFGNPHMPGEEKNGSELNIQKLGANNCVVGITNLPTDAGIPIILKFFQGFSPLLNSVRLHFNNSGLPTGDALIAFPSPMLASDALTELDGSMLGGRRIGIKLTQPPPGVM